MPARIPMPEPAYEVMRLTGVFPLDPLDNEGSLALLSVHLALTLCQY
jgi:hypothetical protein